MTYIRHYCLAALICLLVGCEASTINTRNGEEGPIDFVLAPGSTTTNEFEYLQWLFHNYIRPELLPGDNGPFKSHLYITIELAVDISQYLDRHEGIYKATKADISGNCIVGYSLVESKTHMQLRYLYSWSIRKAKSISVMANNDYYPEAWTGDPTEEPFYNVVQASRLTDAILDKSINVKEGRDSVTSTVRSFLLVSGYVDGGRCVYVVPTPNLDKTSFANMTEIEENASVVIKYGQAHFRELSHWWNDPDEYE